MSASGNHGQMFPRDRAFLYRLYWQENMTLPEMGEMYGVTHKSILAAMRHLGIPTRPRGVKPDRGCKKCGGPVKKIWHAGLGVFYGRLCALCRRNHYNALSRAYIKLPRVREYRRAYMKEWSVEGNRHPQTEQQWINKGRHLLRTAKRHLAAQRNRAV